MALVCKPFGDIITFTRASTGTFFNSAGVLTSAAIDVPRLDYNPVTLAAQGLLIEEARTNLITSSAALPAGINVTITADTFVAPDGTTTGDQILDNATLGEHYSDSSFTPVAATNYTFSAFIKNIGASSSGFAALRLAGDFTAFVIVNLSTFTVAITGGAQYVSSSIQAINNGWYRISLTGVSVGTVASVARVQVTDAANLTPYSGTGEGFAVWGRQLEAGAFPTSYIPTTTTALTRSADVASVNTLSPWYNATEGTLFAEAVYFGLAAPTTVAANQVRFFDGTGSNIITLRNVVGTGSPNADEVIANSGTSTMDTVGVTISANTIYKRALGYKANDGRAAINGAYTDPVDTTVTVPVVNALNFGFASGVYGYWIRRITYYPRRVSDAELLTLTV